MNHTKLAENLVNLRRKRGVTQETIANFLGVTKASVSKWETGFGEDNCGNETNLAVKGDIQRTGAVITTVEKSFLLDIVGRYTVTINGKSYDTVCVMDIETYNCGVVSEQFLDKNGSRFRRTSKGRNKNFFVCFIRIANIIYGFINGCFDSMDFCVCHT